MAVRKHLQIMGRNSILEQGGGEEQKEQTQGTDDKNGGSERIKTTVRMPPDLKELVDERANELSLSYNATVCAILSQELK